MTQERLDFVPTSVARPASRPPPVVAKLVAWRDNLQAHRKAWMAIRGFREIVLIGGAYALYDVTRYFVAGDHDAAISHGRAIYRFEQRLHLDPEHGSTACSRRTCLLGGAGRLHLRDVALHRHARGADLDVATPSSEYGRARTVLMWTTVVGLIGFSLLPVAPPRLLPGFIDTMARYSHYGWWSTAASAPRGFGHDTNQYAAMPSLHVGWAVWCG